MEKIVILTGSFNPPTLAHLTAITTAMNLVNADCGYFVPTAYEYLHTKMLCAGDGFVLSDDIRNRMLQALCKADNRLIIGTPEIENSTHLTIREILDKHPGAQVYSIVGADKLRSLPHWHNAEGLLSSTKFIVFGRGNVNVGNIINKDKLLKKYVSSFIIAPPLATGSNISSTSVRDLFKAGDRKYRDFLLPGVADILDELNPNDFVDPDFVEIIKANKKNGRYGAQKAMKLVYEANRDIFNQSGNSKYAIAGAKVYKEKLSLEGALNNYDNCHVGCVNAHIVDAAERLMSEGLTPAIISNASRIKACGGYDAGESNTTEEELCRCSNLSQSLYQFGDPKLKSVKGSGVKCKGCAYPLDIRFGGIYSPGVTFFRNGGRDNYSLRNQSVVLSVISVPSLTNYRGKNVNKVIAEERKYFNADGTLNADGGSIQKDKIRTALRIALINGHDSIVIGDFGVTYNGISAQELSELFTAVFGESEFNGKFKAIVFAFDEGQGSRRYPVELAGKFGAFYKRFGRQ